MSEKHEEFEREYVLRHEIGNPQTRLDVCGVKADHFCHCGEIAVGEAEATNGWKGFLCQGHYEQSRDARLLRRWEKI